MIEKIEQRPRGQSLGVSVHTIGDMESVVFERLICFVDKDVFSAWSILFDDTNFDQLSPPALWEDEIHAHFRKYIPE